MPPLRRTPLLFLLLIGAALALAPPAEGQRAERERRDPRRLTNAELVDSNSRDALEAVRKLRPHWLSTRGQGSLQSQAPVRLYVDGVPRPSMEELRNLQTNQVASMEYLNGGEATMRWGTGHASGAIFVRTL